MSEIKERTVYQLVRTDKPDDGTDIYVGSTSLSLKELLCCHRTAAKIRNSKLYRRMNEVGIDNWGILPLLVYVCDKKTIRGFEEEWIKVLNTDLNAYSSLDTFDKWRNTRNKYLKVKIYYNNVRDKTYYCNICDKSFGWKNLLQRHLNTLKHSYAYLNSVD